MTTTFKTWINYLQWLESTGIKNKAGESPIDIFLRILEKNLNEELKQGTPPSAGPPT